MIQAVSDTNVLASGAAGFFRPTSTPGEILRRWLAGGFELVVSAPILDEFERTLRKPSFQREVPPAIADRLLVALNDEARIVPVTFVVRGVASHPEDEQVLATAASAGVDYLVTGDKPLQNLGTFEGITILKPRAFLDVLSR